MISLDSNPDYIPPKSAELKASATYAMNIAVQNASAVKVTIDPAGLVTNAILGGQLGHCAAEHGLQSRGLAL